MENHLLNRFSYPFHIFQADPAVPLFSIGLQQAPSILLIHDGVDSDRYEPIADVVRPRSSAEVEVID